MATDGKSAPAGLGLRRLSGHIGTTLVRQGLTLVIGFGTAVFLARVLGAEGKGMLAVAMLLPSTLAMVLNFGVSSANVYHVSRGTIPLQVAFVTSMRLWIVVVLTGGIAAGLALVQWGDAWFPGVPQELLGLALLLFPIALCMAFNMGLLQAVQDFRAFNGIDLARSFLMVPALAVGVGWLRWGVAGALGATLISQVGALLLVLFRVRTHLLRTGNREASPTAAYWKVCLAYGWKAHLGNIVMSLNYRLDLYLVNLFLGPVVAGVYSIAVMAVEQLWLLSQAVSIVLFPRLAELHEDKETQRRLTPLVARWVLIFSLLGAAVGGVLALWLIVPIFGAPFAPAAGLVVVLLPGIVIFAMARVLAHDIAARGLPELNLYSALIILTVNVTLNLVLIPRMGATGAAVATTTAYTVGAVSMLVQYVRVSRNPWWAPFWFSADDGVVLKWAWALVGIPALRRPKA